VLGPRFTDRIVAVNVIGTKVILLIAALSFFLDKPYLLDICLIYTLMSFLAVVVLTNNYMATHERKAGQPADAK
jgi:multicomponent Na+:H+ antiporter subunit F